MTRPPQTSPLSPHPPLSRPHPDPPPPPPLALAPRHALDLEAVPDVPRHRPPGQDGVLLEHDPAVRPRSLHRDPIHLDHAVPVWEEPREDVEEGGLAATARDRKSTRLNSSHT